MVQALYIVIVLEFVRVLPRIPNVFDACEDELVTDICGYVKIPFGNIFDRISQVITIT